MQGDGVHGAAFRASWSRRRRLCLVQISAYIWPAFSTIGRQNSYYPQPTQHSVYSIKMHFSLPLSLALLATLSSVTAAPAPARIIVIGNSATKNSHPSYPHGEAFIDEVCKGWCIDPVCAKDSLEAAVSCEKTNRCLALCLLSNTSTAWVTPLLRA
jgi:hypothetical protein